MKLRFQEGDGRNGEVLEESGASSLHAERRHLVYVTLQEQRGARSWKGFWGRQLLATEGGQVLLQPRLPRGQKSALDKGSPGNEAAKGINR